MSLGLGLGDPREIQASPKGHAWVTQGLNGGSALFAMETEKGRVGEKFLPLIGTDKH
jgi:hypothetical protein